MVHRDGLGNVVVPGLCLGAAQSVGTLPHPSSFHKGSSAARSRRSAVPSRTCKASRGFHCRYLGRLRRTATRDWSPRTPLPLRTAPGLPIPGSQVIRQLVRGLVPGNRHSLCVGEDRVRAQQIAPQSRVPKRATATDVTPARVVASRCYDQQRFVYSFGWSCGLVRQNAAPSVSSTRSACGQATELPAGSPGHAHY